MNARDNYRETFVTTCALAAISARYMPERGKWNAAAKPQVPCRDPSPWNSDGVARIDLKITRGLERYDPGSACGIMRKVSGTSACGRTHPLKCIQCERNFASGMRTGGTAETGNPGERNRASPSHARRSSGPRKSKKRDTNGWCRGEDSAHRKKAAKKIKKTII